MFSLSKFLSLLAIPAIAVHAGDVAFTRRESTTGDTQCVTLMCMSAIVNSNSTVTYVLQSTGAASLGWIALGFGSQMSNTPMVILWPNDDGSITLSQRQAPMEVMPTVVSNPPRTATKEPSLSDFSSSVSKPKLAFTIPANSDTDQNVIWAFGEAKPSGSAVDATLQQHLQSGTLKLNLQGSAASFNPADPSADSSSGSSGGSNSTSSSGSSGSSGSGSTGSVSIPYLPYQKLIIAHAVLCSLGFIVLLPFGVFIARYLRLVTPHWFKGHALTQFWISGPIIIAGFALGVQSVKEAGGEAFNDKHKVLGLILFICYLAQCALGAFIHFVKDPNRRRRPAQNYLHAMFGLTIIGLSLWQVYIGFHTEWPSQTGRGPAPGGVKIVWIIWTALISVTYIAGLALLKKQFNQERSRLPPLASKIDN